ncbi:MAG: 16S rRNA (adenine(1518)-N(6)/adenine(1519)-N(6))-dimethyltransferase [Proteobacteria bacterium]|nr:MAG: 16S rRNA (adenine(1518)-N(6)/adenine(1519)-N(6))-dimethyltransferase [Pseudomonadota bacterium]PIE40301.1 MAG: 16S rRNA (adenine(1518)-N(6)/adenine(1519)-N(6))-dimethyltransferase [Gammaproteobacteria bacterium]
MSKHQAGHRARKRFGQNFLHDKMVIGTIIRHIDPQKGQRLVEIGPGMGALTEELLLATDGELDVIELDKDLVPILRTKFFNYPRLTIHEGDALKFPFGTLLRNDGEKIRVVGNLPYNISTPLIFHLLRFSSLISDMYFMLQKEVVERMAAGVGDSAYGRLGIMVQYYCRVTPLFMVPPGAFTPRPKVDSAVVRLIPHTEKPVRVKDEKVLETVVRSAFTKRRKTVRNALSGFIDADAIESLGINPGLRPENLSLTDFALVADWLHAQSVPRNR